MQENLLLSGRDTLLVGIPFVFILLIAVFRLDGVLTGSRGSVMRRPPMRGTDEAGEPILTDPDGRLVERRRPARRVSKVLSGGGRVIEGARG
jgi:hypothetical protein